MWIPVLLLQALMGFGVVSRVLPRAGAVRLLAVSVLLGLPMSSGVVFLMDLAGIPIRLVPFLLACLVVSAAANLGAQGHFRRLRPSRGSLPRPYEWVFLLVILVLVVQSWWRAFYFPGFSRDAMVGMDLVAKYAVSEGTIHSSVFTWDGLDGYRSNQPYYAPFTMLMQVVFRLAGGALGKTWLSILLVSFVVFLYGWLRERLHPIFAGMLVACLLLVPSLHSYTSLVTTDYPNALYFGLTALFFYEHLRGRKRGPLVLASLFMAAFCWSRTESVLLVPYPFLVLLLWGDGGWVPRARRAVLFAAPPLAAFLLWHWLYFSVFLEGGPPSRIQGGMLDPSEAWRTIRNMMWVLTDPGLFGTLVYLFAVVLVLDLAVFRSVRGLSMVGWMAVLLAVFVFIVHHVPAATVEATVKRGFLKLFPVMVFYLGQTRVLEVISERMTAWEGKRA